MEHYLDSIPQRMRTLLLQAVGTEERFERSGKIHFLDAAVETWRQLVEDHAFPFTVTDFQNDTLHEAGRLHLLRYQVRGRTRDLQRALEHLRAAYEISAGRDPDVLNTLSNALREHARLGNAKDLAQAIQLAEEALESTRQPPAIAAAQTALGLALIDRYRNEGTLSDLERAMGLFEDTLLRIDRASPDWPSLQNNRGLGFAYRFERTDYPDDLHRAVEAFELAIRATRGVPPELPVRLHNLSKTLVQLYLRSDDPRQLDRAIDASQRGLEVLPSDSVDLPMLLEGRAEGLLMRGRRNRDIEDLRLALEHWDRAHRLAPPDSSQWLTSLAGQAEGLIASHDLEGKPDALVRARDLLREVCSAGVGRSREQVWKSARKWIHWAFERRAWEEVGEAWEHADRAMQQLLTAQIGRHARETWLREAGATTKQAGFAIAKTGDFDSAAVAIERGLARLLAASLRADRAQLTAMSKDHPDLVEHYREAARRVARFEAEEIHREGRRPGALATSQKASSDLKKAIEEIRRLPGHEGFLRPAEASELAAAARALGDRAALVYLATTDAGSLALVVTAGSVDSVWDPLDQAELEAFMVRREGKAHRGGFLPGALSQRKESSQWLREALGSMDGIFRSFLGGLAAHLRQIGTEKAVLLPVGRLRALPLHIVSYEHRGQPTSLIDEFIVSHAPNAVAVLAAVEEAACRNRWRRLVAVGNPLPSPSPLPASEAEARQIATIFPESRLFLRQNATRTKLLETMSWGDAIHLGCHGLFDLGTPLASRLHLAGKDTLTLRDFLDGTASLPSARLAVLSACRSAVAEPFHLVDEVVSLPSGILGCGVPGVVGTLWPVSDTSTAILMVKFYQLLNEDSATGLPSLRPAAALCTAQCWLRDASSQELQRFLEANPELPGSPLRTEETAHLDDKPAWPGLDPASDSPYKDHPYHWAPFVYYGV